MTPDYPLGAGRVEIRPAGLKPDLQPIDPASIAPMNEQSGSMLDDLIDSVQYSLLQSDKERILLENLKMLTARHTSRCPEYQRIIKVMAPGYAVADRLEDLPYLPVALFKSHYLKSIPDQRVHTILTSSGTTGQAVSRVAVDTDTARYQSKALTAIMKTVLGKRRLPMLIADNRELLRDPTMLSARGAGVLGMMLFGHQHTFALHGNMSADREALIAFLTRFGGEPFLVFGFTFMVWKYLLPAVRGLDLSNGILIHSGGWKKLADESVTNDVFKATWEKETGLKHIRNFYGMVEQIGSVFLEGSDSLLYPPNFAEVIIRDPYTLKPLPPGKAGIIQLLSLLPHSYPGHNILTEDMGVVEYKDREDGWRGKGLRVLGRVAQAELRGCGDVHAFGIPS